MNWDIIRLKSAGTHHPGDRWRAGCPRTASSRGASQSASQKRPPRTSGGTSPRPTAGMTATAPSSEGVPRAGQAHPPACMRCDRSASTAIPFVLERALGQETLAACVMSTCLLCIRQALGQFCCADDSVYVSRAHILSTGICLSYIVHAGCLQALCLL